MCSTSWSVSCDTRRSAGRLIAVMISEAFFGPIPWIYRGAMRARLLVGSLPPAIRATFFCSCCRRCRPFPRSRCGENAKCRDDTRPSARAGIVVVLMQNGCRVLKDSKSFRQPLLMTELTPSRLPFSRFFDGLGRPFPEGRFLCRLGPSSSRVDGRLGYLSGTRFGRLWRGGCLRLGRLHRLFRLRFLGASWFC